MLRSPEYLAVVTLHALATGNPPPPNVCASIFVGFVVCLALFFFRFPSNACDKTVTIPFFQEHIGGWGWSAVAVHCMISSLLHPMNLLHLWFDSQSKCCRCCRCWCSKSIDLSDRSERYVVDRSRLLLIIYSALRQCIVHVPVRRESNPLYARIVVGVWPCFLGKNKVSMIAIRRDTLVCFPGLRVPCVPCPDTRTPSPNRGLYVVSGD